MSLRIFIIELLISSGLVTASSAATEGGVSGLFLKKIIAKTKRIPVITAYKARAFTIFILNSASVSSFLIKIVGILKPTAVPKASATTVHVRATILSSAPNQTFANLAGMLTRNGYPIAHII